jgi:hypothetical protein
LTSHDKDEVKQAVGFGVRKTAERGHGQIAVIHRILQGLVHGVAATPIPRCGFG